MGYSIAVVLLVLVGLCWVKQERPTHDSKLRGAVMWTTACVALTCFMASVTYTWYFRSAFAVLDAEVTAEDAVARAQRAIEMVEELRAERAALEARIKRLEDRALAPKMSAVPIRRSALGHHCTRPHNAGIDELLRSSFSDAGTISAAASAVAAGVLAAPVWPVRWLETGQLFWDQHELMIGDRPGWWWRFGGTWRPLIVSVGI